MGMVLFCKIPEHWSIFANSQIFQGKIVKLACLWSQNPTFLHFLDAGSSFLQKLSLKVGVGCEGSAARGGDKKVMPP